MFYHSCGGAVSVEIIVDPSGCPALYSFKLLSGILVIGSQISAAYSIIGHTNVR